MHACLQAISQSQTSSRRDTGQVHGETQDKFPTRHRTNFRRDTRRMTGGGEGSSGSLIHDNKDAGVTSLVSLRKLQSRERSGDVVRCSL
eukprot:352398-Chlamydomonas_euryale.AAC.5